MLDAVTLHINFILLRGYQHPHTFPYSLRRIGVHNVFSVCLPIVPLGISLCHTSPEARARSRDRLFSFVSTLAFRVRQQDSSTKPIKLWEVKWSNRVHKPSSTINPRCLGKKRSEDGRKNQATKTFPEFHRPHSSRCDDFMSMCLVLRRKCWKLSYTYPFFLYSYF